ncbi:MAG: YrdB family protein [Candidatus Thorarchaeota archaeon]
MNENNELKGVGANDVLRFILEIWALIAFGYWGLNQNFGLFNYVLAIALPIAAAAVWGTFAVPDDPSRSGGAPVPVPGVVRLVLELLIFGLAFLAMFVGTLFYISLVYVILVIVHYILARDRIRWLLSK